MKQTSPLLRTLICSIAMMMLCFPALASAKTLTGTWEAQSISRPDGKAKKLPKHTKIKLSFSKDGKFLFAYYKKNKKKPSKTLKGTWTLRGDVLITVEKKTQKTETMIVSFRGPFAMLDHKKSILKIKRIR